MVRSLLIFVIFISPIGWAATQADFSGNYAPQQKKSDTAIKPFLRVVQTDSAVKVTRVYGDKSVSNTFPLDGSEGDYTTETGVRGKCKAQLKGGTLVLESLVASPRTANTPSLRFDTIEKWRLSADSKTLTVKTEIKCPDMPPEVTAASFPDNPRTEKYLRSDAP